MITKKKLALLPAVVGLAAGSAFLAAPANATTGGGHPTDDNAVYLFYGSGYAAGGIIPQSGQGTVCHGYNHGSGAPVSEIVNDSTHYFELYTAAGCKSGNVLLTISPGYEQDYFPAYPNVVSYRDLNG